MKKTIALLIVFLLLAVSAGVFAQDGSISQLPYLLEELPDPAQVLGSIGTLYQEGLTVYDRVYNAYLFPKPSSEETFTAAYREEAENAGYTVEPGTLEVYDVLRIFPAADRDNAAILFPDYQSYVFFLVPPAMNFTLHEQVPDTLQPFQMVELGSQAIAQQEYQTAIRYLIRAAEIYMQEAVQQPEPTPVPPTAVPTEMPPAAPTAEELLSRPADGTQVYVVKEGDSCWSIAAQFGMDITDFMTANNFTECNIQPNDEVIIPAEEEQEPTPTPLPGAQRTYVVEAGDNCWSIAADKFGVNFELFMSVNGLTECNIMVGQELIIPGADQQMPTMTPIALDQYTSGQQIQYVVEMNDSYNDIANKFNTTLLSIQQLNNVNAYTGFPQYGQVLTIAVNLVTPTPSPEPTATPEVGTLAP